MIIYKCKNKKEVGKYMKNKEKNNFTKLTQKKGVSLIILIVTIIGIIILAAAVILTLSKNNPVESAREATFKEDIRSFQNELALSISKDYTIKSGKRDEKFNAQNFDEIKEYIPSFTKGYEGKIIIKNDELMYKDIVTEKESEWFEDIGVKLNGKTALDIAKEPKKYYGQKVTNYESNGVSDWKIFYSDEKNIYLITSEYVDVDKLPATSSGAKPQKGDSTYSKAAVYGSDVQANYSSGSDSITDERIKSLNNDYFNEKKYTSSYNNIKSVAYMLDIEIWKTFAEGNGAEYAIGSPTIEMLMKSYSQKYDVDYRAQASSNVGYDITKDGGKTWENTYSYMFNTSDMLYVLPSVNTVLESGNKSGADSMWVASPSTSSTIGIVAITFTGTVGGNGFNGMHTGFRPMVCLKNNVELKTVTGGYEIQ